MRRARRRLSLLLLPLASQAHAGVRLVVEGVEDPLKAAAIAGVELSQYATREVSDAQVRRLYERAPGQVKSALEPYGYYDASVTGGLQQVRVLFFDNTIQTATLNTWTIGLTVR